jgi:hypothetical protein
VSDGRVVVTENSSSSESLLSPFEAAVCGSVSGMIAAAITTPLDVAKTRLMLGKEYAVHVYML